MLLAGPPRIRPSAEIQANSDWTPDPFDVAQGRGEHSRTTIKAFGGDAFGSRISSRQPQLSKESTKVTDVVLRI
jgi:hypothetical protein